MISYRLFDFASLPGTGASWMLSACRKVGLGHGELTQAHIPFRGRETSRLRISLVRHPCNWIEDCYLGLKNKRIPREHVGGFIDCSLDSFENFVLDYIKRIPGEVGLLYHRYQADSVMRIEDVPVAFYELLESVGIPGTAVGPLPRLGHFASPTWNPKLRRSVCSTEKDSMERFDYWA